MRALPDLERISASFQDEKLVDEHLRQMCTKVFGVPTGVKQNLTDQHYEMVREVISMRTGTDGAQMMAANAAILEEFDDVARAPGSRRDRTAPGPSQRRESGEDPTNHGRWWQDRQTRGGGKGGANGQGKGGSYSYAGGIGCIPFSASIRRRILAYESWLGMEELSLVVYLSARR